MVERKRTFIANIKGSKGDPGPVGPAGANQAPTDTAISSNLETPGTLTRSAAQKLVGEMIPSADSGVFSSNITEASMGIFWNALRAGSARVSVHGSSTPYGHFSGGPYVDFSWPGRLSQMLAGDFGRVGPGMMIPWNAMVTGAGLTYQPAFNFAGTVEDRPLGIYGAGAVRITKTGTSSYVELRDVYCDTFRVFLASTAGSGDAVVDGVSAGTIRTVVGGTGTLPLLSGYASESGGGAVLVTDVPAGRLGNHTLRLMPNGADGAQMTILAIEPLVTGRPGVVVNNFGLSGITSIQAASTTTDTTTGYSGMSMSMDAPRAHLQIIQLGTNDYQQHFAVADFKARVLAMIQRAKTSTPVPNGGITISSNVLLVEGQPVNEAAVPGDGITTPPIADYWTALLQLRDSENVGLSSLNAKFVNFATGNALGWYADNLHPSPKGHREVAKSVLQPMVQGV